MGPNEARVIIYLIDLVVKYGVPAAIEAYNAWFQDDPQGKEPEKLREYVKPVSYYKELAEERKNNV